MVTINHFYYSLLLLFILTILLLT